MTLRNSRPIPWRPKGLSDTLYSGTSFPGAMMTLQNLIPDPTSTDLWQCRPAALVDADPDGTFPDPGFVSCMLLVGTRIYGMLATSTNAGNDEPFCWDIVTQTYIAISGVTGPNTPVSPATTGAWTPPHMAVVGTFIVVTHPGFTGGGGAFFGLIDIADPNALAWSATNTTGLVVLTTPPTWVAQYNGRACYFVNPGLGQPALVLSDSLDPATVTNADQVLTFGDNVPITCGLGLPLNNQLGGIIQALIVFKGASNLFQVTGDYGSTDNPLTINSLNVATGTLAPNSLAATPYGMAFISPEGLRIIDFQAQVSDPVGLGGLGITVPFIYAQVPSRIAAAYAGTIYRVSVQNTYVADSPQQDFWYDFSRKIWHGPHTFPASLIQPYNNSFYLTPLGDETGRIFESATVQSTSTTFIEDGDQMSWRFTTPLFPNTDQMAENAMVEATLYLALVPAATVTVRALNGDESVLDTVLLIAAGAPTIWGAFTWGVGVWQGVSIALGPKQIPWDEPIVFQRLQIDVSAECAPGIAVGPFNLRYEELGYLSQDVS